jgi:hypothetical protein
MSERKSPKKQPRAGAQDEYARLTEKWRDRVRGGWMTEEEWAAHETDWRDYWAKHSPAIAIDTPAKLKEWARVQQSVLERVRRLEETTCRRRPWVRALRHVRSGWELARSLARKLKLTPPAEPESDDRLTGAINALDTLIVWCDGQTVSKGKPARG